jgi:polyisoprenoid-binding protein YceI
MRTWLLVILSALSLSAMQWAARSAPMPPDSYRLDREHSSLHWKVNQVGLSDFTGRFTRFDATLAIDPLKPENAKLVVTIDPTSIRTDFPFADTFDKELVNDVNFFNSSKYPNITFVSTKIVRTGEKTARLTGDLKMLGIVKQLTFDVKYDSASEHRKGKLPSLHFSATAGIKRSEFGIVTRTFVADDILIFVESDFISEPPF